MAARSSVAPTATNGKWLILVDPLESGSYIAKVKRHIVDDDELVPAVCLPDFSRGIVVD